MEIEGKETGVMFSPGDETSHILPYIQELALSHSNENEQKPNIYVSKPVDILSAHVREKRANDTQRIIVYDGSGFAIVCRVACGFNQRLCGLIGTHPGELKGDGLAFLRCSSLHTFGMAYPLDILFITSDGLVVSSNTNVNPCRIVNAQGADIAIEREASGDKWPHIGDVLSILSVPIGYACRRGSKKQSLYHNKETVVS